MIRTMVVPVNAENTEEDELLIDSESQLIRVKVAPKEAKVQTQILESKPPKSQSQSQLISTMSKLPESGANENGSDHHSQHGNEDDLDVLNSFHYFQLARKQRVPNGRCLQSFIRTCSCFKGLNCCCSFFSPPWPCAHAAACDCGSGGSSDVSHLVKIDGTAANSNWDDVDHEDETKSAGSAPSERDSLPSPTLHLLGLGSRGPRAGRSRAILCDFDNSVHVDVGLNLGLDQEGSGHSGVPADNFHNLFSVHIEYDVGLHSSCFGVSLCACTADADADGDDNDITAHVEIRASNRVLGSFTLLHARAHQAQYDHNQLKEKSKPKRRYRIECWNGKQIHVERQRSPFTGYDYLFTNIINGQQEQIIAEMKSKPSISSIEMVQTLNSATPSDLKGTWIKTVLLGFMIAVEVIS